MQKMKMPKRQRENMKGNGVRVDVTAKIDGNNNQCLYSQNDE